jgi:hypothetical protein
MPSTLDIPQQAPFLQATLEHSHVRMAVEPNDDAGLAYELLIPKTWAYSREFGPVPTGMLIARGIGFFAGAAEPGSPVIAVTITKVPYEIPIDVWARATFLHEGWEIVAAGWFPGANGLYFDLTGIRVVNDVSEVRRSAVRVRGTDIFTVNCLTARKHWDAVKELFWLAITSFDLAKAGPTRMEPWLEANVAASADRPGFTVAHPATWLSESVTPTPEAVSALDVRLLDAEAERLLGYLQVKALRRAPQPAPPASDALKVEALASVERSGFATGAELLPLTEDDDPRSIAVEGWLGGFTADGTIAGGDVSLRLGFVVRGDVVFTFSLLSPRLANNPLNALRAIRVFEIARATLSLQP